MGVPGLWDIIQEAGYSRAFLKVSVEEGFEANKSGFRGLRVGIDASLWYFHAENSTDVGSNPELRLLAFRCFRLLKAGVVPLFMFDGPGRPEQKRGSRKGKRGTHWLNRDFTHMLECFGMEWRMAPGEAEAELAYLNRMNIIDAVITDDVDTFLFGGRTIIRNMSGNLTGNKKNPAQNNDGNKSDHHVRIFEADAIESRRGMELKRGGMILFALLSGGDYDNNRGFRNLKGFAHGLARLGFGDRLLQAYHQGPAYLRDFLPVWREELGREVRTNESGLLPGRKDIQIPATFPDLNIFKLYADPLTSARTSTNGIDGLKMRDRGNPSLPRLAEFCQAKFDDWGGEKVVLMRFTTLFYPGLVMHLLRRAMLEQDEKERTKRIAQGDNSKVTGLLKPFPAEATGMPSSMVTRYLNTAVVDRAAAAFVNRAEPVAPSAPTTDFPPLFTKIVGTRSSVDTDKLPEYKLQINPAQFVKLASQGFKATPAGPSHSQPTGPLNPRSLLGKAAVFDLDAPVVVEVPASMLREIDPQLIVDYEAERNKPKAPRKTTRRKKAAQKPTGEDDDDEEGEVFDLSSSPAKPTTTRGRKATTAAKRQAASSPVRPPPAKRPTLPSSSQPPPAPQPVVSKPVVPKPDLPKPLVTSSQADRKPVPPPVRPQTPPREVKVKEERVSVSQNNPAPARAVSRGAQPTTPSRALPSHVVPRPLPLPVAQPQLRAASSAPPPSFPRQPREFFNVGLIETEEPPSDRHFIFSYTDPDDPDYMIVDDQDWKDDVDVAAASNTVDQKPLIVARGRAEPALVVEPRNEAGPSNRFSKPSTKPAGNMSLQPIAESVEELWEQLPPTIQPRRNPPVSAVPPPAPLILPDVSELPRTPPRRRTHAVPPQPPSRPSVVDNFDLVDDHPGDLDDPMGLARHDHMFDQILGIVPGAKKKKRSTATARKRAIAELMANCHSESQAPQSKRRRTDNTNATPTLPMSDLSVQSTARANQASTSRAPPPVPLPDTPMGSSQPTNSRAAAQFPDLPPLGIPSASQPSRPASRSRPVHRLNEVVVVSSDEEEIPLALPRRNAPPATPSRARTSTRGVASAQPRAGPSRARAQPTDFFANVEYFKDLS